MAPFPLFPYVTLSVASRFMGYSFFFFCSFCCFLLFVYFRRNAAVSVDDDEGADDGAPAREEPEFDLKQVR